MNKFKITYTKNKSSNEVTIVETNLTLVIEKLKNWQGHYIEITNTKNLGKFIDHHHQKGIT